MQKQIAHFKILREIGRGGMGVVYKALDVRLKRFVAIKVLSPKDEHSDIALHRFMQESRTASRLNHPNICAIYDIGTWRRTPYIVMEYLEGETLRQLLDRKIRLSESQVIEIGIQLCDAIQAAHEKGIIHRDIKPENIIISKGNLVKIMDFGLAKLKDDKIAEFPANLKKIQRAKAMASYFTSMSTILGTISYISPEQIQGKRIDARADVFAIGVVLYELLAGKRPFDGEDNIAILNSIVDTDPMAPNSIAGKTKSELDDMILKSLSKSPERRYHSAAEMLNVLKILSSRNRNLHGFKSLAIAIMIILALAFGFVSTGKHYVSKTGADFLAADFKIPTLKPIGFSQKWIDFPTFSRNGEGVIYAKTIRANGKYFTHLFCKTISDNLEKKLIFKNRMWCDYSRDGKYLTYFTNESNPSGVYLLNLNTGQKRLVSKLQVLPKISSKGNFLVFGSEFPDYIGESSEIFLYDVHDGSTEKISPDNGLSFCSPEFSPDERWIVCIAGVGSKWEIWLIDRESQQAKQLTQFGKWIKNPLWCPSGKFIYFISDMGGSFDLWKMGVDLSIGKCTTGPRQLTTTLSIGSMDISPSGDKIVFNTNESKTRIYKIHLMKNLQADLDKKEICISEEFNTENLAISPDGEKIVSESFCGGLRSLMIYDTKYEGKRMLYRDQLCFAPCWSADGNWIFFDAGGGNDADIWKVSADGGEATRVFEFPGADWMPTCSPDGQFLCFLSNRSGFFELWTYDLANRTFAQLTDSKRLKSRGAWSQDGRKIAYFQKNENDKNEELWLFDVQSGKSNLIKSLNLAFDSQKTLSWSPNDSVVIFKAYSGEIRGINVYTQEISQVITSGDGALISAFGLQLNDLYFDVAENRKELWLAEGLLP